MKLAALVLLATFAHADVPTFVSLDRTTATSHAGGHFGIMFFEDGDSDGGQPTPKQPRIPLYGQYAITPNVGVIGSTSLIRFSASGASKTGLGSTRIGGYGRYATHGFEVVGRASLILPTASFIPRDSYYEDVAVHGTLFPWLEERAIDADAFWVQFGTSLRYRNGGLTVQLDGFMDIPLSGSVYEPDMSRGNPFRFHAGAGFAYQSPMAPWRFGAEVLVSGYTTSDQLYGDLEAEELTWYGITASVTRILAPDRELVLWFSNPANEYLRSRWHAVGIGYQQGL